MVELLAIKDGNQYIHWDATGFTTCALAKASVFPCHQEEQVISLLKQIHLQGATKASLVKLTIHEEPYTPSKLP